MNLCKNTKTELYFTSVKDIPETIWNELGCSKNFYFNPDYLLAIEKNNTQIVLNYIVLLNLNKEAIALGVIQIIDFPIEKIEKSFNKNFDKLKCFGRKLGIFPKLKPIQLLVCGNIFVSGEYGVFIKEDQNKQKAINNLAKAISHLVNSNKSLAKNSSIFLIKDFIKKSLKITDELHDLNYYSFNVEPNMVLELDNNWSSFEAYLEAMKTKFRVKAKRAMKLSNDLIVKDATKHNIESFIPEITALYQKVANNADFNLGDFNLDTCVSLKVTFDEKYILKTYWYQNKMVGFMSGVINNHSLDAHFVGIDYLLNKRLAIYQRMLYDYVKIALDKKLDTINFGRTASEIKSSIGAIPQDLTCYIRHKKSITNKFLKPFLSYIEPKSFVQKKPFKSKSLTN